MHAGRSLFSPLVKSLVAEREEGLTAAESGREALILAIDRRLRFLAADSRSTLRGRWPAYRQVLLMIRDKLGIRCSSRWVLLSTKWGGHPLQQQAEAWQAVEWGGDLHGVSQLVGFLPMMLSRVGVRLCRRKIAVLFFLYNLKHRWGMGRAAAPSKAGRGRGGGWRVWAEKAE